MTKLLATGKTDLLDKFVSMRTRRAFKAFLAWDAEAGKVTLVARGAQLPDRTPSGTGARLRRLVRCALDNQPDRIGRRDIPGPARALVQHLVDLELGCQIGVGRDTHVATAHDASLPHAALFVEVSGRRR